MKKGRKCVIYYRKETDRLLWAFLLSSYAPLYVSFPAIASSMNATPFLCINLLGCYYFHISSTGCNSINPKTIYSYREYRGGKVITNSSILFSRSPLLSETWLTVWDRRRRERWKKRGSGRGGGGVGETQREADNIFLLLLLLLLLPPPPLFLLHMDVILMTPSKAIAHVNCF